MSNSSPPSLTGTDYRYDAPQRCPQLGASQTEPEPCNRYHDNSATHKPNHPYPPDTSDRIAHGRKTVKAHKAAGAAAKDRTVQPFFRFAEGGQVSYTRSH